jgi:hypothetical protein
MKLKRKPYLYIEGATRITHIIHPAKHRKIGTKRGFFLISKLLQDIVKENLSAISPPFFVDGVSCVYTCRTYC